MCPQNSKKIAKTAITPPMVEAGLSVLAASGRLSEGPMTGDRLVVEQIYRAMTRKGRQPK
jgi:hypothetical protein